MTGSVRLLRNAVNVALNNTFEQDIPKAFVIIAKNTKN